MKKEYINFFSIYKIFLETDAYQSLIKGRNRNLLLLFYENFTDIIFDKYNKNNFKKLASAIKKYSELEKISIFNNVTFAEHLENRLKEDIKIAFNLFYNSIILYNIHKDKLTPKEAKLIVKKQIDDFLDRIISNEIEYTIDYKKNGILYQGLIEFNNALSHIFNALTKREPENNFQRAISHLHRGTLDILKTIIKDLILLDKINPTEIKALRKNEYLKIGNEEIKRTDIIKNYSDFLKKSLD